MPEPGGGEGSPSACDAQAPAHGIEIARANRAKKRISRWVPWPPEAGPQIDRRAGVAYAPRPRSGKTARMDADAFATLEAALSTPETNIVVRSASAIVELLGPLPMRLGSEWLTIGEEGKSHVHVRMKDVASLRFGAPEGGNAHLELLAEGGDVILRVAFRATNPEKADKFQPARRDELRSRFGHLERPLQ
jgi:hypothetical protein